MRRRLVLKITSILLSLPFLGARRFGRKSKSNPCGQVTATEKSETVTAPLAAPSKPDTKVVILGGGPAGMATAFWLTSKALKGRFEVTVYTPGWRLGGKCASGRNQELGQRIEEHGLHMLMGCYRYAFNTIRNCYAEWHPRAGNNDWHNAFTAVRQITLEQPGLWGASRDWTPWNFVFPRLGGDPGDPIVPTAAAVQPLLLDSKLVAFSVWLEDHLTRYVPAELLKGVDHHDVLRKFRQAVTSPTDASLDDETQRGLEKMGSGVRDAVILLYSSVESEAKAHLRALMHEEAPTGTICPLACKWILAELGVGVASGWIRDIVKGGKTLDSLNELDFRQWLKLSDVSDPALASAPIRALYDLTFAFPGGDTSKPSNGSIAAGVSLRFILEAILGYKDAPLWKMEGGTGDVLFTPLYQVLKARGVAIKFFHRLAAISPTEDGTRIGNITLIEQAQVLKGDYDPFVVVNGADCWPNRPKWELLVDGDKLKAAGVDFESPTDPTQTGRKKLNLGQDFDIAVLAVPPDVIKTVAGDLAGRDSKWDQMLQHSASVATEAFQLWMKTDLGGLGWSLGPTVLTAFAEPFSSWADMSHLRAHEQWPAGEPPRSVQFFCGCLKEPPPAPDPRGDAWRWLQAWIATLWPAAAPHGSFDPNLVVADYYRKNLLGSERYVQTPPGSVKFRLSPDSPVFQNLYLAGDWTVTRFSGGCVESAMESGTRVAAALST